MEIVSVNLGHPTDVPGGRQGTIHTGIDKQPVETLRVGTEGAEGDTIVHTRHHGGPGQAVYLYARTDYEPFEAELGRVLPPGTFGENVTVDAWPHDPIRIGDRFTFGGVVLEVSAPRIPCVTFAGRMRQVVGGDLATGWVRRFTQARRPGWYCRVIAGGDLGAGQTAAVTAAPEAHILGLDLWDLHHAATPDPDLVARALASPIDDRSRAHWSDA